MKLCRCLAFFLGGTVLASFVTASEALPYIVPFPGESKNTGSFFAAHRPAELLRILTDRPTVKTRPFTIRGYIFGWVQASDIPELMALIDSSLPCAEVVTPLSSDQPQASTVGIEARHLVLAYWKGYYPAVMPSSRRLNVTADELRAWYGIWRQREGTK